MKARKILLYVVLVIVAINLTLVAVVFMGTVASPPPAPTLPSPNGYDDFVRAEKKLTTKSDDYKGLNREKLHALVAANAPAMALVRDGLSHDSVVPLDDLKWKQEQHVEELNGFKLLVLAFSAEAAAAEEDHHFDDSATIWLDLLRFSHAFTHGGAFIDETVGWQGESFGLNHMISLTNALDSKACTRVAKTMEDIDAHSDSMEQILNQDKAYTGKLTFHQSLRHLIHHSRYRQLNEDFAAKLHEEAKQRREVMVAFAVRAFELEKGKHPASFSDLVPAYLKTVPQDPVTGGNLDYKF